MITGHVLFLFIGNYIHLMMEQVLYTLTWIL